MSRGHLSKRLPDAEAIRLFAEHHIVQVRRRKNGEILAVKHATFGWITPQQFYGLQKMHDILPMVGDLIHGAYQLKWALANVSLEGVPIGGIIYAWALGRAVADLGPVKPVDVLGKPEDEAALLIAGVMLPFGELLLIYWMVSQLNRTAASLAGFFAWVLNLPATVLGAAQATPGLKPPITRPGPQMPPYRRRALQVRP